MKPITKLILVLILVTTAVTVSRMAGTNENQKELSFETKENSAGNVTISVTPLRLTSGFPASFDVVFETHSVELTFDIEQIAKLSDETGATYVPHWEGSPPGGHHRSGTLRFTPDLSAQAGLKKETAITLTMKDIADVPSRTFSWEVKK